MIFTNTKTTFEKIINKISKWNLQESELKRLKKYLEDYKNGDVTRKQSTDKNVDREADFLKPFLEFMDKDIKKRTTEDNNKFFIELPNLRNKNNKPYKTTPRILKSAKKYLEYHEVDNKIIKPLTKKLLEKKKSKDIITLDFLENELIKNSNENWKRYFHCVLWWGGLRISEFLGLKPGDILIPNGKSSYFVKIQIRRENTKSDAGERVITLYGKDCNKIVQTYLNERKAEGMTNEDYIFNKSYDCVKSWLYRLSHRVKKPIHAHLYRHSSASYLSRKYFKGNLIKVCDFFGWEYNSPMAKTYIRRKTLVDVEDEEETEISNTKIEELEGKLEESELKTGFVMEVMQEIKQAILTGNKKELKAIAKAYQ